MANWKGTPVPNTGLVENVYFNTALSVDEVVGLLENLTLNYDGQGELLTASSLNEEGNAQLICILKMSETCWTIQSDTNSCSEVLFISSDVLDIGYVGWNPNITYPIVLGYELQSSLEGEDDEGNVGVVPIGTQNNLLSSLFSITPFVEVQEEVTLNSFLTGIADAIRSKKGTTDKINASNFASEIAGISGGGAGGGSGAKLTTLGQKIATPVPNTGIVETVYFNTDLSVEEVTNIIESANLTYIEGANMYPVLFASNESQMIAIQSIEEYYMILDMVGQQCLFHNVPYPEAVAEIGFTVGWNPSINSIAINSEVLNELEGIPVGAENDKLADIFAIKYEYLEGETIELKNEYQGIELKITENGITNLLPYIKENNEIPVVIKNNVPIPEGYVKPSGTMTITENGTYDVTNYASVEMNIPIPEGYVKPEGTLEIDTVGMYDVTNYENATFKSDYSNDKVINVADYSFWGLNNLENISLPKAKNIGIQAFRDCLKLKSVNAPLVESIGQGAFTCCETLESVNLPLVTIIPETAFGSCYRLKNIDLSLVTEIGKGAFQMTAISEVNAPLVEVIGKGIGDVFYSCYSLKTMYVPKLKRLETGFYNCFNLEKIVIEQTESVCTLKENAFNGCTRITTDKDGYIYVPASLLAEYKVATNWATYETQIIGHQDFNVGDTLPSYANDTFTICTWYSDEELTTIATSVTTSGRYYCRLGA